MIKKSKVYLIRFIPFPFVALEFLSCKRETQVSVFYSLVA